MTLADKAKEKLHQVIDEVKENKQLDQKLVLQQTKEELLKLHEDVSYASVILNELKKTNRVDQQKFQTLDTKLRNENTKKEAVSEIARIIDDINARYDNLQTDEKGKINNLTEAIRQSKYSLSGLKSEVMNAANVDYAKIEEELDKNIDEKFKGKWYSGLANPYKKYVHEKVQKLKEGNKDTDEGFWEKIKSSVTDWFFGLVGSFVIGKDIKDMIEDELAMYKDKLQKAGDKAADLVDKGKETVQNFSPEQLKEKEKNLRNYITVLVQKYGKNIDNATLDRVMKRIDIKKLASDNTAEMQKLFSSNRADANVATSLFEGVALPFYAGYELIDALQEEGVISYGDVAYNVASTTLEYGLKGFKLFGTGIKVAFGKISMDNIEGEIKNLYDKSPDAAKSLIWAIMYRTQHSPIFKIAANAATLMSKAALWPLLESKDDIKSLSHISDGLHGHMTTAVNELEEFVKYLPDGETKFIKNLIKDFRSEVSAFKEINQINLIYKELYAGSAHGSISLADIEKKYLAITGESSVFLENFKDRKTGQFMQMTENSFTSAMKAHTELIGNKVKLNLKDADAFQKGGNMLNKAKSAVKFRANELSIMEDAVHYLEASTTRYSNMMNNRGWFAPMKDTLSGLKGGVMNMQESLTDGKTYFNFHTAEDFEQFMKKAKYLGKQSPETLKFLIGKTPIFLVGGMALAQDGSMSEKMETLSRDVLSLVPIIGPGVIIWNSAKAGKLASGDPETWGEMGLGATLLTTDAIKIVKYGAKQEWVKLGRYMFQPVTDIVELTKFAGNATKNSIILTKDFINVAKTRTAAELGEAAWTFIRSEGRLGKLGAITALVAGGYFTWDYFFSSNDIDDDTKEQLAKYKDNPEQLDKDIEAGWSAMKQEERNNYIRAAMLRQGGFSPEKISKLDVKFDEKSKTYIAVIPSIISYDQVVLLKHSLEDAVTRVQPGSKMSIQFLGEARYHFTKDLSAQFADIPESQRKTKIEEYVRAMGYENPAIVLDEKSLS